MKNLKKIAFLAVAAIAPAMLALTSCSKDDNKEKGPAQMIEGTYNGNLGVTLAESPLGPPAPAVISIVANDANNATLSLDQSSLSAMIEGGKVTASVTVKQGATSNYTFTGSTTVYLAGDTAKGNPLTANIAGTGTPTAMTITIGVPQATVVATFTGSLK